MGIPLVTTRIVRIKFDGSSELEFCFFPFPLVESKLKSVCRVRLGQRAIKLESAKDSLFHLRNGLGRRSISPGLEYGPRIGQSDEGEGEVWVSIESELEILHRLSNSSLRPLIPVLPPFQVQHVSLSVLGRLLPNLSSFPVQQFHLQRVRHIGRNVRLDGEYVLEVSIVALGPEVFVLSCVEELNGYSDSVSRLPNAPL